ncbi:MAG: UDP-N-acetylmuramoyl-L-alanyl-D-glutamate--2,6-diaminopimelate ligase [Bacteroidales bacterium]|nr:UDP-N-acetylmuramoyl-L-alanyl-D-glutamate--2,6-diaminopimelate ligase [Bacteroidales bacterium]
MKLKDIISGARLAECLAKGPMEQEVDSITLDSRAAKAGSLFVAQKGEKTDGHKYIHNAILSGCRAVVCEVEPAEPLPADCAVVTVPDTHEALGLLASAFYGHPSRQLKLVGVTGTNGKTTIATLLYRLLTALGHKSGLFSTVANYVADEKTTAMQTTPDAITLQKTMRRMVDQGCEYCFMEVSSHSVVQKRIEGLDFDGAIFTNITHDHLDFHKTFQNYIAAKKGFFDGLKKGAFALTNVDDKNGVRMLQNTAADRKTYSLQTVADFRSRVVEDTMDGMLIRFDDAQDAFMQFVGRFNAYNLTAIYAAACLLGFPPHDVLVALSALKPVDGRFQTVKLKSGATAIVDYAHTPDALMNVLTTLHEVRKEGQKIICLVGCGGDRDKTKRPEMAHEAVKDADKVILTSDNPRTEDPLDILADMKAGLSPDQLEQTLTIPDRREAIQKAAQIAQKGDIILVAGKGHEDYQEINGVKHHFSDLEELQKL